ncbi:MAG: SMP-30/gluconolactonase/LRE family protein, partial [Planctomycetota bacterium JB042]
MRHLPRLMLLAAASIGAGCSRSPVAADDPGAFAAVVADDARLRLLVTGLRFTEGPVWSDDDGGFLVFSDMTANRLMRWS